MALEILFLGLIILAVLNYNGTISANKFIADNEVYLSKLKESDWDFYVKAKYGDRVDPNVLYQKRLKNMLLVIIVMIFIFLTKLNYINILFSLLIGYGVFKLDYINIKNYYKSHLHEIDEMLPHYLKSLEILIQHYTVPVAIGKSIDDAPPIFRDGLQTLINEINAGNSTIDPYMQFAKTYPVRDSMRMMRLLYRLSLGKQERKQEQLLAFSKTISNLQQKAREKKYKNRLEKMESKTNRMLVVTGLGVMILLVLAVLMMMNI